ncbi:putative thymine dioxygenase protein [Botrytis fragariae]|uniref:Putative thymine dioxygenase protein n=1 Tax=Botrytis fragariae TaxID=1964551 RepID=A0A8H6B3D6_9HELO|nr:putative thymine dioxygenase protein [Botrytis fragariae]KAF5878428.1 putative thymine dioxygenase protein [Botrytis fragariae]
MASNSTSAIPIVDFTPFLYPASPTSRLETAKALVNACRHFGFVYIINHDIPSSLLEEAFAMTKQLFALSHEAKMQAPHPPGPSVHRGYSYPGLEKVYQVISDSTELGEKMRGVKDCKLQLQKTLTQIGFGQGELTASSQESYEIGSEKNPSQPNIWLPESTLPNFHCFMQSFYHRLSTTAQTILLALGTGLELQTPSLLADFHSGHTNQLRLLHYPPIPASEIETGLAVRLPAHTDFGSITMVFQDECGGLEIEHPKKPGEFIRADPVPNAIVMNIGDLLMRWTNDDLKSSLHRVQLPPQHLATQSPRKE